MELATRIASKSLPSLMATKRLLLDAEREGIARARTLENQAFAELLALPNAKRRRARSARLTFRSVRVPVEHR